MDQETGNVGRRARLAGGDQAGGGKPSRPPSTTDGDQRNKVNALAKGFRILEAFSSDTPEMTLSEIAAAADLDPGTTFRMVNTLVSIGYVARVPDSRRFRLTLKVLDLGFHAIGHSDLREVARPILRSLVGEVNEAASLGVLDGSDILYIERVRAGITRIGVDIRVGTTIPAALSAIGQAMLAFLSEAELKRVLSIPPRQSGMPVLEFSEEEIRRAIAEVRQDGYALRDSYFGSGLRVLAVPVLDIDRYPVATISVAAPSGRMSSEEFRGRTLGSVRAAAADIGRCLQASGSISITG